MAFKMKGFMPYGKSPMRQEQQYIPFDFEEDVSTEDISQTNPTNATNPTNDPNIVMLDSDYEGKDPVVTEKRGLRFWKKKQNASSRYDPEKTPINENVQHGVKAGPTYKGKFAMNQSDQKEIQKQIEKQGHFGDIPPSLMKGYGPENSHSYRARVGEINNHEYMVNNDPYDKGKGKRDLHQQLSRKQSKNWNSRFSDFEGDNTYDKSGNVRRKYGRG